MNEKRNGALDRYPIEKKRAGRPSVTVKEDGAVIFYLYAPAAKIVQVAGLGGYFTNKKIDLMPDGQGGFFAEVPRFSLGDALLFLVCGRCPDLQSVRRNFLWVFCCDQYF